MCLEFLISFCYNPTCKKNETPTASIISQFMPKLFRKTPLSISIKFQSYMGITSQFVRINFDFNISRDRYLTVDTLMRCRDVFRWNKGRIADDCQIDVCWIWQMEKLFHCVASTVGSVFSCNTNTMTLDIKSNPVLYTQWVHAKQSVVQTSDSM